MPAPAAPVGLGRARGTPTGFMEQLRGFDISYGPGYRIYFGQSGTTLVLLLCGGEKGTQQQDIETAREYWTEYRSRNANQT